MTLTNRDHVRLRAQDRWTAGLYWWFMALFFAVLTIPTGGEPGSDTYIDPMGLIAFGVGSIAFLAVGVGWSRRRVDALPSGLRQFPFAWRVREFDRSDVAAVVVAPRDAGGMISLPGNGVALRLAAGRDVWLPTLTAISFTTAGDERAEVRARILADVLEVPLDTSAMATGD